MLKNQLEKIIIIGAGPAGLFCAYQLLKRGHRVDLYDQQTGVGKKFLVAGNGGLNLTHSEDLEIFCSRYGKDEEIFKKLIAAFSPENLRQWCAEIGTETFIGSSGRVFPTKLKAAEILSQWVGALKKFESFNLSLKHKFINIDGDKNLTFDFEGKHIHVKANQVIFALGGASWERTGSDGKWRPTFEGLGIKVKPFLPMNCGFQIDWSDFFKNKIEHVALKNIVVKFKEKSVRGEVMLTSYGIEGGAIYALSNLLRDALIEDQRAQLAIDLKPDLSLEEVQQKLLRPRGKKTFSTHLQKTLNLSKAAYLLFCEANQKIDQSDHLKIAMLLKNLPLNLQATRPLSEAISTSGGIAFSELDEGLELKKIPGVYVVGEMLDFEAPTGGYLLQGCFATAWRAVESITDPK